MSFILNNIQRRYLGLDPIKTGWEIIEFPADQYRPKSYLVFDKDILKRHIISTKDEYREYHYDDKTRDRKHLKSKTARGKEKSLTPSNLEARSPIGVYFNFRSDRVTIGNHSTQTTFFSTEMEDYETLKVSEIEGWLANFISESDDKYLKELDLFKKAKRRNIKIKAGDFFRFKIDRKSFGFGRVISNIDALRKKEELSEEHGLNHIMTKPLLVKVYHHLSQNPNPDLTELSKKFATPSQYIMDNRLFYGEYPIIGNSALDDDDLDFPISYGRSIHQNSKVVCLQWGIIHRQLPLNEFNLHLQGVNNKVSQDSPSYHVSNPHHNAGVGFQLNVTKSVLELCISTRSNSPYWKTEVFGRNFDLRNPKNKKIASEILKKFKLDSNMSYSQNLKNKKFGFSKLRDRLR